MAANDTIEPLMAVHRIGYGDKKEALPGTPFTPTSVEDRVDLINLGAARELTDAERNVFAPTKKLTGAEAKKAAEIEAAAAEAAANAGTGTENLLG